MKRKSFIFFLFCIGILYSQENSSQKTIDSLKNAVAYQKGLERIASILELERKYLLNNEYESVTINQQLLLKELKKSNQNVDEYWVDYYNNNAIISHVKGDIANAIISLQKGLEIKSSNKMVIYPKLIMYSNLASLLVDLEQYQEAINYLNDAEKYFNTIGTTFESGKTSILLQKGDIYFELYTRAKKINAIDYKKYIENAKRDYLKAYALMNNQNIGTKESPDLNVLQTYCDLGQALYKINYKTEAENIFKKTAEFSLKNKLLRFFFTSKSAEIEVKLDDITYDKENLLKDVNNTINIIERDQEKYNKGYVFYYFKAKLLKIQKNSKESIYFYEKALVDSEKKENFEVSKKCITALGELYSLQGNNIKSIFYKNKLIELYQNIIDENSLYSEQKTKTILEIEAIKQAKALELEMAKSDKKFNFYMAILLAFILSIIVIIALILYNRNLKTQKELLKTQIDYNKELLMKEELDNVYQIKLDLQNKKTLAENREKIARNLHDDLASGLAALNFFVQDKLSFAKNEYEKKGFIQVKEETVSLYQNIKSYINNLYRNKEETYSVSEYLINLLKKNQYLQNINIDVNADFSLMDQLLTDFQQNQMYHTLKEAITNSFKYSKAKNININITFYKKECTFQVKDDGVGIGTDFTEGIGLLSMKERIESLNGKFEIKTGKDIGTIFQGNFPL